MQIKTFQLGALKTNCFILWEKGHAVAVDAGQKPEPMLEWLREKGLELTHILLTHLHADHVCGVRYLQRHSNAETWGSAEDGFLQDSPLGKGGIHDLPLVPPFEFTPISPGRQQLLAQPVLVLDTPGHSPGGLSYYFPRAGAVFVGDTLFKGSVGRTDWEGGHSKTLLNSLKQRIFILPDETRVFSGHGPATTIGSEKQGNVFFTLV